MVQCKNCSRIILDSTQDGGYKIRSRMILFKGSKAIAICPTCKAHVDIPVLLGAIPPELPKKKFIIKE